MRSSAPTAGSSRSSPGYEPRAEQAALAAAVESALASGEHLLAEAGTGTGKSLAYLIPALDSGQRVVVSTATKALQEQLLTKDVPIAAAALGREFRVAVLKGRQNYLCRQGLQGFGLLGGQLFPREEDALAFEAMRDWIDSTETGDRAELDVEPPDAVWSEIAVGADRCLGRRCAFSGVCFSEAARDRAAKADLIVVNHALYFADLGLRSRTDAPAILPEHDAVVFDEAHRLEESAASWLGGRISGPVSTVSCATPTGPAARRTSPRRPVRSTASRAPPCGCCARSRRKTAAGGCARSPPSRPRRSPRGSSSSPESLKRMKAMGLGWLMQNAFYFRGEAFLGQRGLELARVSPPIVTALKMGIPMGSGTDAHRVMSYNPFVSLRWMLDGKTAGGIAMRGPEELPSRIEALRLYTQGSAWFSFDEKARGSLAAGQLADLAVLSKDYLTVPTEEIGGIVSLLTMVGGRVVYADGPFAAYEEKPR